MTRATTQTLTIEKLERRNSSAMGNPSFWITFTNGTRARTRDNSGISYAIENPEFRAVPVLVTFTAVGTIENVEVA